MVRVNSAWLGGVLAALVGCEGGEKRARPDAGDDAGDDSGISIDEPEAPAAPELPRMDCPEGWRRVPDVDGADVAVCDPWPEGGPRDCPPGEAHFPGKPGCEPIGAPCPAGAFADGLPAEDVVHVLAGAPDGGDGTRARPFALIADALRAVPEEGVVALSKGTFDEAVTIRRPVTLWGACVDETVVASSSPAEDEATITVRGRGPVVVRDLTVSGARIGVFCGVTGCELTSVLVREATYDGVIAGTGSSLVARSLVVRETLSGAGGLRGVAFSAWGAAQVDFERVALERSKSVALILQDEGTVLSAVDFVIRETGAQEATGSGGFGCQVELGARLDLRRSVLWRNGATGIAAVDLGTTVVGTDVVISETREQDRDGEGGYAIQEYRQPSVELTRATLAGNRSAAIVLGDDGTTFRGTDVVVRDTRLRESDGAVGFGLEANEGAAVHLSRAAFLRNAAMGVRLSNGATLSATDVTIRSTEAQAAGELGMGLVVFSQSSADLVRAELSSNRVGAIAVLEAGTHLVSEDLAVRDTRSSASTGEAGTGLVVGLGAEAEVRRVAFERNRTVSVSCLLDSVILLEDVLVEGTMDQECAPDRCPEERFGSSIVVSDRGVVEVTRFRVRDGALCGVQIGEDGELDLHEGVVSGHEIGANVQAEGFDVRRIQDRVLFLDNTRTLDTTALPVPDAMGSLGR